MPRKYGQETTGMVFTPSKCLLQVLLEQETEYPHQLQQLHRGGRAAVIIT